MSQEHAGSGPQALDAPVEAKRDLPTMPLRQRGQLTNLNGLGKGLNWRPQVLLALWPKHKGLGSE
eukprot:13783632-Heterocapsa_arctica.AAC.1